MNDATLESHLISPKEETMVLELEEELRQAVLDALRHGVITETPGSIPEYPDIQVYSLRDLQDAGHAMMAFGSVEFEGEKYFVVPRPASSGD